VTRLRGLAAALVLTLASGCGFAGMNDLPLPGGPDVGEDPIAVSAEFTDVLSLARDSTVKYDGVTIGKVSSIGRDGWTARVDLQLRSEVALPANVTARIAQTSLLGEKYVELERPAKATGRLADGAVITRESTSRGREVEEVLGALSLLLNGGGVAQLRTISRELDTALGDDTSTGTFLAELDTFVGTLDRNRATIITALENVDRLSGQIARDRKTVAAALDEITPAVRTLAAQREQLVTMLTELSGFSQVTSDLVRRSSDDLVADLEALEPVLLQLQKAVDDLPRVLETVLSFPFPDEVLEAVKGDYVNLDVLVDLSPLTVLGNVAGDDEALTDLPGLLAGGTPAPAPAAGNALTALLGPLLGALGSSVTGGAR
jgi:phospholipid/cholesterol/gamma-HCH transport system substrate-binding protein